MRGKLMAVYGTLFNIIYSNLYTDSTRSPFKKFFNNLSINSGFKRFMCNLRGWK